MQTFFFSTYRSLDVEMPFLKNKGVSDKLAVFYSDGNLSDYDKKEDYYVANLGCLIYEDKFNRKALELLVCDSCLNRYEKARGQFVILTAFKDVINIVTDKYGTIPVYMKRTGKGLEVSNVYSLLVDGDCTINRDHVKKLIEVDWSYPEFYGTTLHNEITYLSPATKHSFDVNTGELTERRYAPPSYYDLSFDELIDCLEDRVESNFEFLKGINGKVFCDVTGGFDTRLNVEYVLRNCKKYVFGNDISNNDRHLIDGKFSDFNIVEEIKSRLGIACCDNRGCESEIKEAVNHPEYEEYRRYNDSHIMSDKRFINNLMLINKSGTVENPVLRVTGWCGTELLTLKPSNEGDDFKDGLSIWRKSFMNCQQNYWGVANLLIPHYSPYLDLLDILIHIPRGYKTGYRIQRALYNRVMRKELRNITTTHGFPSCGVTWGNFYKFLRLFNPFNDYNCQYIGIVKRSIRWAKGKLIYYSPLYKSSLKWIGKLFGYDMDFLDRNYDEVTKYIESGALNRKFLNRQQLLWLKKLNNILNNFKNVI